MVNIVHYKSVKGYIRNFKTLLSLFNYHICNFQTKVNTKQGRLDMDASSSIAGVDSNWVYVSQSATAKNRQPVVCLFTIWK